MAGNSPRKDHEGDAKAAEEDGKSLNDILGKPVIEGMDEKTLRIRRDLLIVSFIAIVLGLYSEEFSKGLHEINFFGFKVHSSGGLNLFEFVNTVLFFILLYKYIYFFVHASEYWRQNKLHLFRFIPFSPHDKQLSHFKDKITELETLYKNLSGADGESCEGIRELLKEIKAYHSKFDKGLSLFGKIRKIRIVWLDVLVPGALGLFAFYFVGQGGIVGNWIALLV